MNRKKTIMVLRLFTEVWTVPPVVASGDVEGQILGVSIIIITV